MEIDPIEEVDLQEAQLIIDNQLGVTRGMISDGSHTFNELYPPIIHPKSKNHPESLP
ncbi:Uncharacterised protein [Streptococcus pneumoniae]|nr:Uncharacterised protein [Streptococcus pneumoniae]